MIRNCTYCLEFEGVKNKIVKLKKPIHEALVVNGIKYEETITHRCEGCGCSYGTGKKEVKEAK